MRNICFHLRDNNSSGALNTYRRIPDTGVVITAWRKLENTSSGHPTRLCYSARSTSSLMSPDTCCRHHRVLKYGCDRKCQMKSTDRQSKLKG